MWLTWHSLVKPIMPYVLGVVVAGVLAAGGLWLFPKTTLAVAGFLVIALYFFHLEKKANAHTNEVE